MPSSPLQRRRSRAIIASPSATSSKALDVTNEEAELNTSALAASQYQTPYSAVCRDRLVESSALGLPTSGARPSTAIGRSHGVFTSYHERLSAVVRGANRASAPKPAQASAAAATSTSQYLHHNHASSSSTSVSFAATSSPSPDGGGGGGRGAANTTAHGVVASTILPPATLRDLCLKLLTQRTERQTVTQAKSALRQKMLRVRRAMAMRFKASVNAVSFTSIITKQRLERLAKKLDHFACDPYVVMPGMLLDPTATCGREVCHFRVSLQLAPADPAPAVFRFLIDRCPVNADGSVEEWRVWLVSAEDTELADEHFAANAEICVIGRCDPAQHGQFVPGHVEEMQPVIGPHYHIIRDFEHSLRATIESEVLGAPPEPVIAYAEGTEPHLQRGGDGGGGGHATSSSYASSGEPDYYKLLEIFAVPLPKYEELAILPPEVQDAINKLGLEVLRRYLYPRLLLKLRRRARAKMVRTTYIAPMTAEAMQKQSIFASWPQSLLEDACRSLVPLAVDRGEFIIHEDENAGSGIFFLVSGTVEVLKKVSRTSKSIGPNNTKVLVTLGPPACFGEFAFLTEDPRMASVKAVSHCTLWQMVKTTFHRLFAQLPPSTLNDILTVAFKKRTANVLNTYPLNVGVLASYSLFSRCSPAVLQRVIPAIRPFAVPKGTVIIKADEQPKVIFFLRRGKCGVFRYVRERKEDVHILTLNVPAVIGDDAVIFNTAHTTTIKALTNCDLYLLPKDDFEAIMTAHPKQWAVILEQASANRQAKLNQSQYRYKEMAVGLPFVSTLLPLGVRVELMHLFMPVVYGPRQVVCSAADFADRVVIVVEGSVRFESGELWEQGESAGFTCVVPHRWERSAVSRGTSKVIEISVEVYTAFLKRHGVYERVVELVKALMFPKAADPNTLYQAILDTQELRNPPMYPISSSPVVNLHEPRFGLRVMRYGGKKATGASDSVIAKLSDGNVTGGSDAGTAVMAKGGNISSSTASMERRRRLRVSAGSASDDDDERSNAGNAGNAAAAERSDFVAKSMASIEARVKAVRVQKGVDDVKPLHDGSRQWMRGGTLLMQRERRDPRRPALANHPILDEYRRTPLASLGMARPSSAPPTPPL